MLPAGEGKPSEIVLELRNVSFHHAGRPEPVLRSVSLQVKEGDRLLLESGSGSGKSSLVSLIAGLRRPQSGLVLAGAFDQVSLGPRMWSSRVAVAPQFQENHVLTAPFAFNLLMGRPGRRIWRKPKASAVSWNSVLSSSGCRAGCNRWSANPGGSFQAARRAACSWRAPCCKGATLLFLTRALQHSIRKRSSAAWNACANVRGQ